jgi:hypothetical protein
MGVPLMASSPVTSSDKPTDRDKAANGDANPVRPVLSALGKDAHLGPVSVSSRMAGTHGNLRFFH